MRLCVTLLLFYLLFAVYQCQNITVKIGVLFNVNSTRASVELAAEYMKTSSNFAPITWNILFGNTGDTDVAAVRLATEFAQQNIVGLIGPRTSLQATSVSTNVSNIYKIPLVAFWATSSALSNRSLYPYFMRVVPPDSQQARAMIDLIYVYEWSNVGVIALEEAYGLNGLKDLQLYEKNIIAHIF
jgi:hypothetical protein